MSLARNSDLASSTSESARLFLLSPVTLRPMTSHARIEGGALYTKGEREVADLCPVPRKSFLPQLATKCANGLATLTEENSDSDTYRQKMWAGQDNILVTVRLRPLLSHDRDRVEIVKVLGNKEVVVLTRSAESRPIANSQARRHSIHSHQKPRHASASPAIANGTRRREKHYAFDYVFTPNDGQQKEEIATLKKELLRQQEKAETSRHSPPESERRWVERKKSSADNNSDDEDWMTIKLREARLYITECFQERRRLRHALLKLEHQIQHRAQELQSTQNAPTVTTGPSIAQSSASPSKSATVVNEPQIQEKESDANVLTSQGSSTTVEAAKKDTEDQQLAALSLDREGLMQQLARNERAMDEFHRGIEQSPLMERNALIREVLLMEYRIGNLEIDKMQLQTLRDLQMNNGVGEHGNNEDLSMEYLDASFVPNVGRELHLDLPALASDRSQPQTSDRDSDRIRLPKIKSGKGFLEELREHLYPSKSNSHRAKHQEVAHTVAVSPVTNNKHWGLHLNNASLPYIRLKKKNPIPLYVQPTTSGSLAEVLALGRTPPVKSLAEPYLKSLKKRHKPRGKHSKNAQALK
ncbi:hypothetical protein PC121_g14063 [Phytophthora cactorum]|nr:hypothetical protein PC121_g14063 [Phytophthora cactorum]